MLRFLFDAAEYDVIDVDDNTSVPSYWADASAFDTEVFYLGG
ncbi:hypothetical protein [Lactobacillus sp. Sy-1]|nr:hypothetical protein [Lactobacillus sp. Sy-1]